MNDTPTSLLNLLTCSDTERALTDDSSRSIIWCKHGLQRRRSNYNGKFVCFQKLWSKNLL